MLIIGLLIGAGAGYGFNRYLLKKKYLRMIDNANKEAEVIKEKKLLEVKEKFLNKKSELEKEVQQRNQKIQQVENKLKQREIGLNQRLNQGIHQQRKPPEGIDTPIVPYFCKRHKAKQKKTPVPSLCGKRANVRLGLFRDLPPHAVFADDGERRVFSGKAELFAA